MQGVNILNQTEIVEPKWNIELILAVSMIAMIFGFVGIVVSLSYDKDLFFALSATIMIVSLFVIIILGVSKIPTIPTGRYRYECTIDESVSMTDIHNNYIVIEQRGDIWVLEDK